MNKEQIALARKLVDHPAWPARAFHILHGNRTLSGLLAFYEMGSFGTGVLPDLTDDATAGVLIGMIQGDDPLQDCTFSRTGDEPLGEMFACELLTVWGAP